MKPRAPMTLNSVLEAMDPPGTKTAAATPAPPVTPPSDAEKSVTQKCAELLDTTKTAGAGDPTRTQPATELIRQKVAELADATMDAEVERQSMLGAAYVDGAMRRYAAYVPVLESIGMLKNASQDLPLEKFAEAYPDIYKEAEALGYTRQRDEIAVLYNHTQKLSYDRVAALSLHNARELYLRGFEDVDRVIRAGA